VLVRDYQGRRHTVTVRPDGYVWEGNPYSSLSAIARAITGTAWSGPRFFALKSFPAPRASAKTTAPGCNDAATSRSFSAAVHRRRRSTEVMTSTVFAM